MIECLFINQVVLDSSPVAFAWVGAFTLSLLLKLPPRKLEPWFTLSSYFVLSLCSISINLAFNFAWNTVVMSGQVLVAATWNCYISYKSRDEGLLALGLLPLLNPWLIVNMQPIEVFSIGITFRCSSELAQLVLLEVILEGGLLIILLDCMSHHSVTILIYYKDVYVSNLFPYTARLWNFLPIGCFFRPMI